MEENRHTYIQGFGGNISVSLLETPRRRWEGNITIDLKEIGRDKVVWVNVDQERNDRHVFKKVTNLSVPLS